MPKFPICVTLVFVLLFTAAATTLAADLDTATPFGRVTRPEDVAAVVAFLVSADATMVTGQRVEVTSGTPMPTQPL